MTQHAPAYRYPEAPIAIYPNGREARTFDIVEGVTSVGSYTNVPFIAQVVRVLPAAGKAELALISRPAGMADRLPHAALQNVVARIIERDLQPLDDLKLRSRASRAVASYIKSALG